MEEEHGLSKTDLDDKQFSVLKKRKSKFDRLIFEMLFIRELNPELNTQEDYRAYSHDVTAAILVSQNNETAAMLVCQTNSVGVELFSYFKTFFCSSKFAWLLAT